MKLFFILIPAFVLSNGVPLRTVSQNISEYSTSLSACTPLHYKLELNLAGGFSEGQSLDSEPEYLLAPGKVTITAQCLEETSRIVLNSRDIEYSSNGFSVKSVKDGDIAISSVDLVPTEDLLVIHLKRTVVHEDVLDISIKFQSKIKEPWEIEDEGGIFKLEQNSSNNNDEEAAMLLVVKPSARARSTFPCFDNDTMDATFDVTVLRKENDTVVFNTQLEDSNFAQGDHHAIQDKFMKTPKLKANALLIVVGRLSFVDFESASGARIRVYYPKNHANNSSMNFTAGMATNMINFYEEYFDEVPDKIDITLLPNFYSKPQSARGICISNIDELLFRPNHRSGEQQQMFHIAQNLASTLVHQWFDMGQGATPYFNEGIRKYLTYLCLSHVWPHQSRVNYKKIKDNRYYMFHATNPRSDESQYMPLKTASVLGMIDQVFPANILRNAIRHYQQDMNSPSLCHEDFLDYLQAESTELNCLSSNNHEDCNLKDALRGWWSSPGYPIVKIGTDKDGQPTLTQESFTGRTKKGKPDHYWHIPLKISEKGSRNADHIWLRNESLSISEEMAFALGIQSRNAMPFMILYDKSLGPTLSARLFNSSEVWRSQLIDNCFALAEQYNEELISNCLDLIGYLDADGSPAVWTTFLFRFRAIYRQYVSNEDFPSFKDHFQTVFDKVLNKTGMTAVLQSWDFDETNLLHWGCKFGSPTCLNYSLQLLQKWQISSDRAPVVISGLSKESRCDIMSAVVVVGGQTAFNMILRKYQQTLKNESLSKDFCDVVALSATSDSALMKRLLNLTLTTAFQADDLRNIFDAVIWNDLGLKIILNFVSDNLKTLESVWSLKSVVHLASSLVDKLSYMYSTPNQLDKIHTFVQNLRLRYGSKLTNRDQRFINASIPRIKRNIKWMNTYGEKISGWMKTNRGI